MTSYQIKYLQKQTSNIESINIAALNDEHALYLFHEWMIFNGADDEEFQVLSIVADETADDDLNRYSIERCDSCTLNAPKQSVLHFQYATLNQRAYICRV